MSAQDFDDQVPAPGNSEGAVEASPPAAGAALAAAETLDAVEDIDFLLEEIENKIAPLALA